MELTSISIRRAQEPDVIEAAKRYREIHDKNPQNQAELAPIIVGVNVSEGDLLQIAPKVTH
jgi:hypothetical protein